MGTISDSIFPMPNGVAATNPVPTIERSGARILVTALNYSIELPDAAIALLRAPIVRIRDASGRTWSELSLLSSAHTREASDDTIRVESIDVEQTLDAVELR